MRINTDYEDFDTDYDSVHIDYDAFDTDFEVVGNSDYYLRRNLIR